MDKDLMILDALESIATLADDITLIRLGTQNYD